MKDILNRTIRAVITAFHAPSKPDPAIVPPVQLETKPSVDPHGDSTRVVMDYAFHQQAEFQAHMRHRLLASQRDLEALSIAVGRPDGPS